VAFGEIGLSGEVRPVSQSDVRLKEAAKLGFERALSPPAGRKKEPDLAISEISAVHELVAMFGEAPSLRAVGGSEDE
jgi:DNA repair protein RadA/Sms